MAARRYRDVAPFNGVIYQAFQGLYLSHILKPLPGITVKVLIGAKNTLTSQLYLSYL